MIDARGAGESTISKKSENQKTAASGLRLVLRRMEKHGLVVGGNYTNSLMVGRYRVGVRVARRGLANHGVTSPKGKVYRYCRMQRVWNLHRHGKRVLGVDFWVLVDLTAKETYVVPFWVVAGKVITNYIGRRKSASPVMEYLDRFDLLKVRAAS